MSKIVKPIHGYTEIYVRETLRDKLEAYGSECGMDEFELIRFIDRALCDAMNEKWEAGVAELAHELINTIIKRTDEMGVILTNIGEDDA